MSEVERLRKFVQSDKGTSTNCPIWTEPPTDAWRDGEPTEDMFTYYSPRAGGVFRLSGSTASIDLLQLTIDQKKLLSRYIYEENQHGQVPSITGDQIEQTTTLTKLTIAERLSRLLECLKDLPDRVFIGLCIAGPNKLEDAEKLNMIMAATECENREERLWLENVALESGWLEYVSKKISLRYIRLTPKGVAHLETLATDSIRSEKAFVAMWFTSEMDGIFEDAIRPAVEAAGYRAYRVDRDESYDDQITDQILFEIKRSRFLIADFTHDKDGVRGGVYFEAGYAKGLGVPIIWCIRKDDVSRMHFDTDHYPHIRWTTASDLRERLESKILAFIGKGPI